MPIEESDVLHIQFTNIYKLKYIEDDITNILLLQLLLLHIEYFHPSGICGEVKESLLKDITLDALHGTPLIAI